MNEKNTKRYVSGFSKTGDKLLEIEFELKPIKLSFLQRLFNIDPNNPNPVERDLIDCYRINEEQAKALQPYIIDGVIDLEKYNWMLDAYDESTCKHSDEYLKAKAQSERENY
ncbi:MAG: hypothetical protein AB7V32_03765 [Candidatus Berkiella sp.]